MIKIDLEHLETILKDYPAKDSSIENLISLYEKDQSTEIELSLYDSKMEKGFPFRTHQTQCKITGLNPILISRIDSNLLDVESYEDVQFLVETLPQDFNDSRINVPVGIDSLVEFSTNYSNQVKSIHNFNSDLYDTFISNKIKLSIYPSKVTII